MKRAWAAFLLMCLWVTIPAGALSFRICLLEERVLMQGSGNSVAGDDATDPCCADCHRGDKQAPPCCVDLEKLPDSSLPQVPVEVPPVMISWLHEALLVPGKVCESHSNIARIVPRDKGRASPSAYRAVLEVWRM